jgi:hypothetical protein
VGNPNYILDAIAKVNYGKYDLIYHVLYLIHPELHKFVRKWSPNDGFTGAPQMWPLSVFFRANLYKLIDHRKYLFNGWMRPFSIISPEVGSLRVLSNLNWCPDPLKWYVREHPFRWPTCTQAVEKQCTFALKWARMNRCSCIHNMQTMPKMTRLENEMLSWLENELRERLHAQAEFSSKADAPIVLSATGKFVDKNCRWNKFLTSDKSDAFSEEVRNMPSNGIRSYVYKLCLNGAVSMETQEISNQHKLCMKTLFTEAFVSADQNLSLQDDDIDPELPASFQNDDIASKWEIDEFLGNRDIELILPDKRGLRLVSIAPSSARTAKVALTVLAQVSRLFILQNETNIISQWQRMAEILFQDKRRPASVNDVNFIETLCVPDQSFSDILKSSSVYFKFGESFVQVFDISIAAADYTESTANKLIEILTYNENTGLYVFRVDADPKSEAILPILVEKGGRYFQCASAFYRSRSKNNTEMCRVVTRSLNNVSEKGYFHTHFHLQKPKGQPRDWKSSVSTDIGVAFKDELMFPCKVNKQYDQLQYLVFIPTSSQTTEPGSKYSLLLNASSEHTSALWSVKDGLKMSQMFLRAMVNNAVNEFKLSTVSESILSDAVNDSKLPKSNVSQEFLVSESIISELASMLNSLQEKKPSVPELLTRSMIDLALRCTVTSTGNADGFVHLLLGYKDVTKETVWLYGYFVKHQQCLVLLPYTDDPVREVLLTASALKTYLDIVLGSDIQIQQLQWRKVSRMSDNSGYYAFKQFVVNAREIKTSGRDYLTMYEQDKNSETSIPSWIERGVFTQKQMNRIKEAWKNEILNFQKQSSDKLYELLRF